MSRKGTSRFGLVASVSLLLVALYQPDISSAQTISPSPSPNGSYTVNWYVPLGCSYTNLEDVVWIVECYTGYENGVPVNSSGSTTTVSGKPPGTYTYELVYDYYEVWWGYWPPPSSYSFGPVSVEVPARPPLPAIWSLTDEQRRDFLKYYAPVIFKRAHEDNGGGGFSWGSILNIGSIPFLPGPSGWWLNYAPGGAGADDGMDWITNYYFDGNSFFGDNGQHWMQVGDYARHGGIWGPNYWNWDIRPTLYTAAIEFMDQGSKELILIYHIYHAMDEKPGRDPRKNLSLPTYPLQGWAHPVRSIHDWERIELHIKNVVGPPGYGEQVFRTVITQHHRDLVRAGDTVQFVQNSTGKHLMVWQAQWAADIGDVNVDFFGPIPYLTANSEPHGQELRYVEDPWPTVHDQMYATSDPDYNARVHVTGESGRQRFHYVFVPEDSVETVATFSAQSITPWNKWYLTSRAEPNDTVRWRDVPRLTYELQDLADIFPTHLKALNDTALCAADNPGPCFPNWVEGEKSIMMVDPICSEGSDRTCSNGRTEMGIGLLVLKTLAADPQEPNLEELRDGYPTKDWWWGCYKQFDAVGTLLHPNGGGFCSAMNNGTAFGLDGRNRFYANSASPDNGWVSYYRQHDYFVHSASTKDEYDDQYNPALPGFFVPGHFLEYGWHTPEKGGFDGRYVQLFDDRRPLQVRLEEMQDYCFNPGWYSINQQGFFVLPHLSGAQSPYRITWNVGGYSWQTWDPPGSDFVYIPYYSNPSITVTSADGQVTTVQLSDWPRCPDPGPPY